MRAAAAASALAVTLTLAVASAGAGTGEDQTRALALRPDLGRGILAEVNALRRERGLPRLRLSSGLRRAAERHTLDMGSRGFFDHDSADGSDFPTRVRRFYPSRGFRQWRVGENILWGSPDVGPAQAVRNWLDSPAHRRVLLEPGWREAGLSAVHVRAARGSFGGREVTIVTANFGARSR